MFGLSHLPFRPLRIVLPGGTGQIGKILSSYFLEQGHDVTIIGRFPRPGEGNSVHWNAKELGPWVDSIDGADVVINLAGRSVNCRYTSVHRREILQSRTITTQLIGRAISQAERPPRLWLNASTATIYRHTLDRSMDENTGEIGGHETGIPRSWSFSMDVATAWEQALFAADLPYTRRIALRSAMIMSPDRGGVFDVLLRLVRFGLGGGAGSGRQYVSWIHVVDFVRAIAFLIEHEEIQGVVNLSSPFPLRNRKFMSCLRRAWSENQMGLPAPDWLLTLGAFFLRTETELVLKSRRVVPQRLLDAGFDFVFPTWNEACLDLVMRWRELHAE